MGRYEAAITQATYYARLSYELNDVIAASSQLTDYNPLVFNTGLSLIRRKFSRFRTNNVTINKISNTIDDGAVIYAKKGLVETPCYLQVVDYTNKESNCPHPGSKILYVAFRGTISLKSALTDAKSVPSPLSKLFNISNFDGKNGMEAFAQELNNTGGALFSSHYGFIENLEPIIGDILKQIEEFIKNKNVNKIIITGHSLGGANATLFAMILAGFKKAGVSLLQNVSIHCITFGAPKLFTDYSRNVFNTMLDNKILTLDRVANRIGSLLVGSITAGVSMNLVPMIPPNFVHPGYMVLKHEIKTQSRTGRSKNISDIREMFAGIQSNGYFSFNGLPTYGEFLSNFEQISVDNYESLLTKLPLATLYFGKSNGTYSIIKEIIMRILGGSVEDVSEQEGMQEEKEVEAIVTQNINIKTNNQSGGGQQTELYKSNTIERGPNHIVYNCQKNISLGSCHMAYMGISFWGGMKNISLGRVPFVKIISDNQGHIVLDNKMPGGRRRKTRRVKKDKRRKTRSRH